MIARAGFTFVAWLTATSVGADVTLQITGNEEARFTLECGEKTVRDRPPATFDLRTPVECQIMQTGEGGALTIDAASQKGNVTRFSTTGRGSVIHFRME